MILYVVTWTFDAESGLDIYPPNILADTWYSDLYDFCDSDTAVGKFMGNLKDPATAIDEIQSFLTTNSLPDLDSSYYTTWGTATIVNGVFFNTTEEADQFIQSYKLSNPVFVADYATWKTANNITSDQYWFEIPGGTITHEGLF
jgi:hypothetical protein